jgi:ADP-ribose pyrophosphatase
VTDLVDVPEGAPVLDVRERFAGAKFAVATETVELPGAEVVERDLVRHPGAVGVVALDEDDRVLLVRQYRHAVGRALWELPAGLLDLPGEDPLVCARRELWEETGHEAARWDVLVDAYTSPGMSDESARIYLAREVRPSDGPAHEADGEERHMLVEWVPLDAVREGVLAGRLHNPLLVMGALAAGVLRDRGWQGLRAGDAAWPEAPGHLAGWSGGGG